MTVGNDRLFLIQIVSQCLPYIGYPRSLNALSCIDEACDEMGKKLYESEYIALEMPYGPLYPLGYAQAALRPVTLWRWLGKQRRQHS